MTLRLILELREYNTKLKLYDNNIESILHNYNIIITFFEHKLC